jgi:hypothetical protein
LFWFMLSEVSVRRHLAPLPRLDLCAVRQSITMGAHGRAKCSLHDGQEAERVKDSPFGFCFIQAPMLLDDAHPHSG